MKIATALITLIVAASPSFAGLKAPATLEPAEPPKTDDARTLFNAGRDFMDDGRYNDAEKKFREVLSQYPKGDQADKSAYYLIATLVKLGRAKDALTEITNFQKNYPQSKWMNDVQEKQMSLTDQVPENLRLLVRAESAKQRQAVAQQRQAVAQAQAPQAPQIPQPAPALQAPRIYAAGGATVVTPFGPGVGSGVGSGIGVNVFSGNAADSEISLQQEILRVLLQNDPDRGIDVASERLKADPGDPVVISNLSTIANSNSSRAIPLLVSIAKTSSSPRARHDATFFIGRSRGDKDAHVDTLLDILSSTKDTDTESAVASALAEINTPRSSSALADIVRDKNRNVATRRTALNSIIRTANTSSLLTTLEDLYKNSSDSAEFRRSIVSSMGRSQDARAVSVLAGIAKNDPDRSVRLSAVQSLGSRKEPEAVKALEDLLKESPAKPRAGREDSNDDGLSFNLDSADLNQAIANMNLRDFKIPNLDVDQARIKQAEAQLRQAEAAIREQIDSPQLQEQILDLQNQLKDLRIGK